jgi:hypothetical protein
MGDSRSSQTALGPKYAYLSAEFLFAFDHPAGDHIEPSAAAYDFRPLV